MIITVPFSFLCVFITGESQNVNFTQVYEMSACDNEVRVYSIWFVV